MKKIIVIFLFLFVAGISTAQIKERASNSTVYLGIGYKFVFLTNTEARDAYPFFQLSNGNFLKELDGFIGVAFNEKYAVEFSPAYLFTNSVASDGYNYSENNISRFYFPQQTSLFALPLNIRMKYLPFSNESTSALGKIYVGAGVGAMYISEEMTNEIYSDNTRSNYLGVKTYSSNFWTSDYELFVGINSFSKIGYGFELSYRFVPLNQPDNKPIITSLAGNFNSLNLSANITLTF